MKPFRHIKQPVGSGLCGHSCVAMAAGVSLDRAIKEIGHENGTTTAEIVVALRALGVGCATKLKTVSRSKPILPPRAVLAIGQDGKRRRHPLLHWMLLWDGSVYDPGDAWPDGYRDWRITSYLEIYS